MNVIKRLKISTLPSYGDLMTMQEFIKTVESGGFIDYDGYGSYSDGKVMFDCIIKPSDVKKGLNKKYTHIIWFNR